MAKFGVFLCLVFLPLSLAGDLTTCVKLLRSCRSERRVKAVEMLREIPGRESLLLLLEAAGDQAPEVRRGARTALRDRRSEEDLRLIEERGLAHARPAARREALLALIAAEGEGLGGSLERALEDSDPGVREAAVRNIVHCLGGRGLPMLAAAVSRGRAGRPRAVALLEMARLAGTEAADLAEGLVEDEAWEVRVAALEVLANRPEAARSAPVHSALAGALEDPCWSVRLTAMHEFARLRLPEGISPLIAALGREEGRLREEAGETLAAITGVGLPPDPARWEAWWREHRETFRAPEAALQFKEERGESAVTFHSIPVVSGRVAFVLDRSHSMRLPVREGGKETKAERVESELAATLQYLAPPARFFLVAFGTKPAIFHGRSVPATPAARRRALEWLSRQAPEGRTNLYDALALALDREDVDTVFLLTDGAPSAGEYRTLTTILREVGWGNRFRKTVVHTVEIAGESRGKRWANLLPRLARLTGGRWVKR